MPDSNHSAIEVFEVEGEEIEPREESSEEIVEYEEDDNNEEIMAWFDNLETNLTKNADQRAQKRKHLISQGETFQTVEHYVENVLTSFWDIMTR